MSDSLQALAVAVTLLSGAPVDDPLVLQALDETRGICAELGGDAVIYEDDFITLVDISGDGQPDRMVDEGGALCGPDGLHLYPGTAGGPLHAIIGARIESLGLSRGWQIVDIGGDAPGAGPVPVILQALHGMACGGAGSMPCILAHVWDGEALVSILGRGAF